MANRSHASIAASMFDFPAPFGPYSALNGPRFSSRTSRRLRNPFAQNDSILMAPPPYLTPGPRNHRPLVRPLDGPAPPSEKHPMLAIRPTHTGGPEVLTPAEHPTPVPGPGQVLVRVAAAGVNFIDIYQRTGQYVVPPPIPLGSEGAGLVEAVGSPDTGHDGGFAPATASPGPPSPAPTPPTSSRPPTAWCPSPPISASRSPPPPCSRA